MGIVVSLRTVERLVSHLRRELAAEALATVRFETPPGRQLQIDFGQRRIAIEGEAPIARLEREERQALPALNGRLPFRQLRELTRRVQNDACVDVEANHDNVPWKLIGAEVSA